MPFRTRSTRLEPICRSRNFAPPWKNSRKEGRYCTRIHLRRAARDLGQSGAVMAPTGSSSDDRWVPLADKRAGTIAVCTAACVSLAFILAFSSWVAYLLYRHHTRVKALRVERETRAIRFLASSHGILLGSLIFGYAHPAVLCKQLLKTDHRHLSSDFVQALGFSLSWAVSSVSREWREARV